VAIVSITQPTASSEPTMVVAYRTICRQTNSRSVKSRTGQLAA